ncbi:InlB B-repeat-containing protein [Vagococcus hydrophili]|uniref:Gram-positive cocci surface proteins LPxTG domain-containing protein n=1 Tax=Vagococcus hydrophili TaxID=2714947 RepID=A0A6G8AU36_9ENTE|nr:InlB B-repeat-containing protein [Vagococcus hydrophili]QIL48433.1 hypothetical protein G7082_07960 [Vagococcus hydrophili]
MKKNNLMKRLLAFTAFILTLVSMTFGMSGKVFAEDEPSNLPPNDKTLELFDWGKNWQKNGSITYKATHNPYKKRVDDNLRKPMEFWGEYEVSGEPGDTYSSYTLGTYQPTTVRKKGTSEKANWFNFPSYGEWTISDSKRWQNLPVEASGYTEKKDSGFFVNTYTAKYNLPVVTYEAEGWPAPDKSANGAGISNIPAIKPGENFNDKSVRYEFNEGQKGPAKAKWYMTGEYDNSKVIFPDDGEAFRQGVNHIILVPQLIKVTYRDVDTLEEVKGLSPQVLGKKGSWKDVVNVTGLDATVPGYHNLGFQEVSGAVINSSYVRQNKDGVWSTGKQSKVGTLEKGSSKKVVQDYEQKGIVVWLEKEKANAVTSKKVSKSEVPMEVFTKEGEKENNDHRKVDYSVRVTNRSNPNEVVSTLDDFTLVDELPEGVSLVEPFKMEHIVTTTRRDEVPEKSKSGGKRPYYELSKKTGSDGKVRQVITIYGSRIQVGQYDEFYYTAQVDQGKHDEVKTNTATVTAPNTNKSTVKASFKISDKPKLSTVKRVKNLSTAGSDYAEKVAGKKQDKLQYRVQIANTQYGTPPATGILNEAKLVDKIPEGLSAPTNIQEYINGGKRNIPEKSRATASDKVYYEWNSNTRELTIVEKSPLKVGLAHWIYYDTTIETYSSSKVNKAVATSPGIDPSEGKATVTMFADSNPYIEKHAFKWKEDGTRGNKIKEIGVGESFSYFLYFANEKTSPEKPGTDLMRDIVVKDILPEGLEAPKNVLFDSGKKDNPDAVIPLKTSDDQKGKYYEWDEKTRELKVTLGSAYGIAPNGSAWSITFDTKSIANKPGDVLVNKAELYSDSEKVPKATYDVKVGKDVKVTFHTGDDVITRTMPNPNPQYPGYGNKAKRPKQNPLGYKYHQYSIDSGKGKYDANDPKQGDANRELDGRYPDNKFVDWYLDKEFKIPYNFDTPVTKDVDLYAKWIPNPIPGMLKKAFNRNTLESENDQGPYKSPGNQLTEVNVGDKFSYMAIARNGDPTRENISIRDWRDILPEEVALPTKVELFTVDSKKEPSDRLPTAIPGTVKVYEIFEKSKVASTERDEYYEIVTGENGKREIYFRNLKSNEIIGKELRGFILETKLEKRPPLNNKKYIVRNSASFITDRSYGYIPLEDGSFKGSLLTLYAHSEVDVPWKVEFEPNGGKPKPKDQFVRNEKLATEPKDDQVPKKSGHSFEGWYEDKELTKKYNFGTPVTKDMILYAKWNKDPDVKVTFHTGDDVIKRTKPDPNPQYPGYGNKATRPKQEPLGKEYHNNYKGNNPKPYYDADNKDEGKDDRSTDVRIPDNVFVDWYIDKEFTQKYDFNTPVTEDIDLYAKWKPNPGSGHFKKAFDRSTLDTMQDKGPYKAPGNQLTDIRVGDNFSYMAIARNRDPEPKRDDLIREELEDYLPSEVALPSKVELFTVDGELLPGSGTQTAVLGTMKRHEIFEKSKVNSPDTDEYYEIETHTDGTRIIHFKNLKEKEIKGNNFAGFIMDTKLERRPLINNQKEYTFTNMAQYIQANQKSYVPNKDGTFGESVYRMLAFATVHVPWKVEFEPNGGAPKPKDQFVRNEKLSTEPTGNDVPKKAGYVFEGWYEDKALTKKFDFKTPITRDWILYAKWRKDIEPTIDKSVNKPEFYVGETASYEIKMRNTTNYDLEDAYLKDILAEGMEKPKNIKLDGKEVPEGKNNATSDGEYYTWTQSERKLEVYYKLLAANKQKTLTYDSKILEGKEGEIKINNVELTGSNTEFVAKSKAEFKILANKGILHVKQEVIGKHEDVVVPTTGYMSFDNVKPNNPSDKKNQLSALVPSYEADTNKPYKDIKLKWFEGYTGYQTTAKIPEFYEYDGYQLTTDNGNHASKNKKNEAISLIDMAKGKEYWLTVYVKPKVGEDGPPFYNWDYKTNDFGKVYIQKPKNVRFKFYYLDSSKNRKTVNLVNFETYAEGILPKYFDNLSDYYYKMTIPGAIENKKYSSSGEMKDIVVEGDAVDMTKLPMELPIKIYYTDKNGKEIESVSDFGGNGINNPKVADGTSGFGDIKLLDKEIKDDPNADEIVVSYRYTYTTYINDF